MEGYPVEVTALSRIGFQVNVIFQAKGDGSQGAISEPRKSRMKAGGREFGIIETNLKVKERGGDGEPGHVEGSLGFRLDRRGAAKTGGEYFLEFGELGDNYLPPLKLRMGQKPTTFQSQVAQFIGGYVMQEKAGGKDGNMASLGDLMRREKATRLEETILLPGIPQQENAHDCGFFILEQILRLMQLSSKSLRELSSATSFEIAMLPWPSQYQVHTRKAKLREILDLLFATASKRGTGNVEELIKEDESLRSKIRSALRDGCPSFQKGFERWAAGDWDLSPSPYNDRGDDEEKRKSKARSKARSDSDSAGSKRKKKKKKRRRETSSDEEGRGDSKRRRERSSSDERSAEPEKPKEEEKKGFTVAELQTMSVGKLKENCNVHGVMPNGTVEKADLVKVLTRFAKVVSAINKEPPKPAQPAQSPPGSSSPPAPASQLGQRFNRKELDGMSAKVLRMLCAQRGVLPNGVVEKTDLIQELAKFAMP